jgi:hypothetical protein
VATLSRARLGELSLLTAAWLLLLALSRGSDDVDFLRALLGPLGSLLAAAVAAWLAPGFVLGRLALADTPASRVQRAALSAGLGLAWLATPAAVLLLVGGSIDGLARVVTALDGALVLAYAVLAARGQVGGGAPPAEASRAAGPWLATAAVLALAQLLAASLRRPRFSFGSDEWILMRTIRHFLEARPIAGTWDFDVWDLLLALFVRLARADLVDAYRLYLPPVLIVAASLAFFALAEALFRDRGLACFCYAVLALYGLSDMQTRGEGAGMGLLVRVLEDKYVASVLAVPLAQAAFLGFLRGGQASFLVVSGVISLLAVMLYPLSLVWLGLSVGATCVAGILTGRVRTTPRALAPLGAFLSAAAVLAWSLRSLRSPSYFNLLDPGWPFSQVLLGLSRNQLLILSAEDGWYMAHPALLKHPLLIAAIVSAFSLLPRFRQSVRVQFLVCSTLLPPLLVYNPLTARALGAWITPWMVYRVLWVIPVALTIGCALERPLAALQRRLGAAAARAAPAQGRYAALWVAVLVLLYAGLGPRMGESWRALKARNRVGITSGERELMRALARERTLTGRVLTPRGIGIRLPAWTSRLEPYPALDEVRWGDPGRLREWTAFYAATAIGDAEVALLRDRKIDYVITRRGTPVDVAIRSLPGPFRILYDGADFSLYAWRPERWDGGPAPRP